MDPMNEPGDPSSKGGAAATGATEAARERIDTVRAVIGTGAPDDFILAPSRHALLFEDAAPELARLLRRAELEVAAQRYEAKDAAALAAQARFRTYAGRARAAVLATGLGAALVLVAGGLAETLGEFFRLLLVPSLLVGTVAGGLASMWIRRIRDGRLLEAWMTRRAEAESERLRYFELVTGAEPLEEPLLQLEYFRRYQLDVQRAFYATRGARHQADAERALSRSSLGMAVGGIGTLLAGSLSAIVAPVWATLAGVGLVSQAAGSAAENAEATAQDRRNAERYGRTRDALDQLYALLDRVRLATAADDLKPLHSFVESVHEQLSLEHRQWLEDIAAVSHAVGRLEESLKRYPEERTRSE
jgi:hypothetical protein